MTVTARWNGDGAATQPQALSPGGGTGRSVTAAPAPETIAWDSRTDARVETARQWLDSGGSVLIHGPAEARTSAALDVVTGCRTDRVLRTRMRPRDRDRRYAGVGRLLERVTGADLDSVPAARQGVLTAVLTGHVARLRPAAVRISVLHLLRQLATQRPLVVALDDMQYVDAGSADVLEFVAARVDDLPLRLAVTEGVPDGGLPTRRHLCTCPLLLVRVPAPKERQAAADD